MPRGFNDREKEIIRTALIEKGQEYFERFGLKKTSVEELAQAAGISKGAFYLFFESKEALFMDVIELAEENFRRQVLATVDQLGPSPRARLVHVLKTAFSIWRKVPLLQAFTSGDLDNLARLMPTEKVQEHFRSDHVFVEELIERCRQAGIPILLDAHQVMEVFYGLFFMVLHENDLGPGSLNTAINILLELFSAYCLGEVEIETLKT